MNSAALNPSIFDANALAALKRQTRANDPAALKAAAQQFEALFLQMVLKSMRDATPKEGLFDSDQTRMYESLLDQQLGQVMAAKGGTGLAAMIEKQLTRAASTDPAAFEGGLPLKPTAVPYRIDAPAKDLPLPKASDSPLPLAPPVTAPAVGAEPAASPAARDFVNKVWPHAAAASQATGVPATFLVAQAALETGWGRSEPRQAGGQPSFNLFGIKAGRSWTGPTVEATTTEYVDGVAQQRVERFRAYGSYAEAFADYARLLVSNPRYAPVVGAADATTFARGLQRAGYATDPAYADKLTRIIGGQTLRAALAA
jgi:peptidoglycan hydrolase FlgJ